MLKACWKYFLYILNHKLNVLIECWKEGLYIQGIIHDLSKFSPKEFFPYAKKFFYDGEKSADDDVTVVDISEGNRQYATELAEASGVSLNYVVSDVLNLPSQDQV